MVQAHGLALSIRSAEESETFDLNNQNAATITNTMETAFSEPFPIKDMIRITLVVGAGKQARQMYDAKAAHAVTSTLQNSCGFVEDRGASCVMECAGSYKLQHDTGKNLKTVVVFPKVKPPTSSSTMDDADTQNVDTEPPLLSPSSPAYKLAVCTVNTFENMIASKCGTWSQKRNCVAALDDVQKQLSELDALLMKGTPLNSAQQDLYDSISRLDEKREYVHTAMQQHVEQGKLTSMELDLLRTQNAQRIAQNKTSKALQRKQLLDSITATTPLPKLRHHASMGKLYKEMGPLVKLETESRGRLLSVKETQSIGRLQEIREELEHLENTSREWFEDDDMFNSRVKETRDEYSRFLPRGCGGGGGGAGKSTSSAGKLSGGRTVKTASISASTKTRVPINKWVTPAKGTKSAKKKSKMKKGDLFGAMMMDSDDDDDDDDESSDEEEENEAEEVPAQGGASKSNNKTESQASKSTASASKDHNKTSAASNSGNSNNNNPPSRKKKSKKKKGKGGKASEDGGEILQSDKNKASGDAGQQNETALSTAVSFLKDSVIPLLVALLGWIVSFLFGTNKKKKRKKE